MSVAGTMTRLAEIATPVYRVETVAPEAQYQLLGMRSKIAGPFLRETKAGAEISAARLNRVEAGDFIFSRLFAWQGSFGLIPADLDGCYVSNEFPLFRIDTERVVPDYLVYWFGLAHVQKRVESDCTGSTPGTRNRYSERHFLRLSLELPTIGVQRSILDKIEAVAQRIDEARRLRQEIQDDLCALLLAMAHRNDLSPAEKLADGWQEVALGEVLRQSVDDVAVMPGQTYPHFGIYSFGKGLFRKAHLSGDDIKASRLNRVSRGQFIYGRLNAYEGAFGIVTKEFDGSHVSNEFPIFDCDETRVLPEFLLAYFSAPALWEALKRQVTGIGGGAGNRRIRLKEAVFLAHRLWLPRLDDQRRIKSVAAKLDEAKAIRARAEAEFDALLPAVLDKAFKGEL